MKVMPIMTSINAMSNQRNKSNRHNNNPSFEGIGKIVLKQDGAIHEIIAKAGQEVTAQHVLVKLQELNIVRKGQELIGGVIAEVQEGTGRFQDNLLEMFRRVELQEGSRLEEQVTLDRVDIHGGEKGVKHEGINADLAIVSGQHSGRLDVRALIANNTKMSNFTADSASFNNSTMQGGEVKGTAIFKNTSLMFNGEAEVAEFRKSSVLIGGNIKLARFFDNSLMKGGEAESAAFFDNSIMHSGKVEAEFKRAFGNSDVTFHDNSIMKGGEVGIANFRDNATLDGGVVKKADFDNSATMVDGKAGKATFWGNDTRMVGGVVKTRANFFKSSRMTNGRAATAYFSRSSKMSGGTVDKAIIRYESFRNNVFKSGSVGEVIVEEAII